jgi:subtilisin family serine protease
MSLGGSGFSQAEYDAIQNSVESGVAYAVAAGNSDDNAQNYSPASFDNVLTVSALADFDGAPGGNGSPTCRTDQDDTLADFSNWGSGVEIAAPGVCILSTYPIEQGSYGTISGTSMASPHAAGALALLASASNPSNATDVFNLYDDLINSGNFDWTDDSGDGIKEPLLDVSNTALFNPVLVPGGGGGGGDNPPGVSVTSPSDGATVSGSVTVTASASDDNGVTQVEFFVDGGSIGVDTDGSNGWSASWDTTAYSNGGHTVSAVATDTIGQTGSDSVSVTVDNGGGGGDPISLSVSAYKVRGDKHADLSWSSATSTNVDIYRDGNLVDTTANDGAYTDGPLGKGGGSATYRVCEAGTSTCSDVVNVNW